MKEIDKRAKKCPYCQTDQRGWFRRHPILTFLGILVISPILIGIFTSTFEGVFGIPFFPKGGLPKASVPSPTPIVDEKWFDDASQRYYESHKDLTGKEFELNLAKSKEIMRMCIGLIKSKANCENVIAKKFWIGMPEGWAVMSLGNPSDINTTVFSGLTRKQYVYGNPIYGATYLYFDNEILTSYQN